MTVAVAVGCGGFVPICARRAASRRVAVTVAIGCRLFTIAAGARGTGAGRVAVAVTIGCCLFTITAGTRGAGASCVAILVTVCSGLVAPAVGDGLCSSRNVSITVALNLF